MMKTAENEDFCAISFYVHSAMRKSSLWGERKTWLSIKRDEKVYFKV